MVKKSDVAYVPFTGTEQIKQEIEKINTSDLVNYKEQGVEYQRYSKVKTGTNQYKLFRQETYYRTISFGWTAANTRLTLNVAPEILTKNYYITSLVFSIITDTDCRFFFDDYNTGTNYTYFCCKANAVNTLNFDFSANPLKLTSETISMQPIQVMASAALNVTARVHVNLYGFYEDKS